MTDIEILISNLRGNPNNVFMTQAADTIERLAEQNKELGESYKIIAKLKAERDAAIACIPRACGFCKWYVEADNECARMFPCSNISGMNTGWEWRGGE